jgi:hypothetical protein
VAVATLLGKAPAAARVSAAAAAAPAPADAVDWLRRQPPSAVVMAALEALQGGPEGLSAHLVLHASDRAVLALAAAVQGGGGGGEDGGEGEAPGASAADDLLFFVSTEGDAALAGDAWGADAGSDGEQGSGDGVELGALPEEGDEAGSGGEGTS